MRFVPDDEHNVGGDFAGRLVALLLEGDLRAGLPARLDGYLQDLVLLAGTAIRLDDASGDFHFLNTAVVDLLQRHIEIVFDGRILFLLLLKWRVHIEGV